MAPETKAVQELMVDADYLPTMQIGLKEGRNFSVSQPTDTGGSILVNETLVKEIGLDECAGQKNALFT